MRSEKPGDPANPKAATSPYWGEETLEVITMSFIIVRQLGMINDCAKFGFDRFRVFSRQTTDYWFFPWKASIAYITLLWVTALQCDDTGHCIVVE